MKHSFTRFNGMFPRYQPFTIPEMAAQTLVDGNIVSNGLEAFRADLPIKHVDKIYKSIYKYYRKNNSQWLLFDADVSLVRSSILDDATNQIFITGLDKFRVFDTDSVKSADTTINSKNSYVTSLGKPATPTIVLASRVEGTAESRTYAVAYARQWKSKKIDLGEMSQPALVQGTTLTYLDCTNKSEVDVKNIKVPVDLADRGITHAYVYRSAVTSAGIAAYRYVTDFPIMPGAPLPSGVTYDANTKSFTYKDKIHTINLGEVANNALWSSPPDDLQGIISMRNGVLAAYKDNTIYLSEPYQGHAWPIAYTTPLDYKIVGLGCFGNTLVVCTEANTFMLIVNDPAAAMLIPIQESFACTSRRSIVSLDSSCLYSSKAGVIRISGNGAELITKPLITDKEWIRLNPETIQATKYQDKYLMFWTSNKLPMHGFLIDFKEPSTGILGLSQKIHTLFEDPVTTTVYLLYNINTNSRPTISAFGESPGLRRAYKWTSKKYLNNEGLFTLSAGKVNFYDDSFTINNIVFTHEESSNAFNVPVVNTYSINGDANTNNKIRREYGTQWCIFTLYVDDRVKRTLNVYKNTPFRLPAGFRGDSFFIDLVSTVPISRVQVASSIGELE